MPKGALTSFTVHLPLQPPDGIMVLYKFYYYNIIFITMSMRVIVAVGQ